MSADLGRQVQPARAPSGPKKAGATLAKAVWAISLPLMFAEISEILIHVVDTIFLARVGTRELAAIALGDAIRELWIVPVIGLVEAIQIIVARRHGEERPEALTATFGRGFRLVLVVGLALAAALRLGSPVVSRALASGELVGAVDGFLRIAAYGVVFNALNLAYSALYVGMGKTRVLIKATVVLAVTNVIVSYMLIFGKLGFPRMGLEGAAIALVCAEVATFIFLTLHAMRDLKGGPAGLFRRGTGETSPVGLIRLSVPVALEALVEGLRWLLFFAILEQVSEEALAWSNLVYALFALLLIPTEAFSEAVTSMVSNVLGSGRVARVRAVVRQSISAVYRVTLPVVALVLLFPKLALSIFTSDPVIVSGATGALRTVALAMVVIIPAQSWLAAVFGTGDTDAAFALEVLGTLAMLAFTYVTAVVLELSLAWVWLGIAVSEVVAWPLASAWVRGGYWKRRVI